MTLTKETTTESWIVSDPTRSCSTSYHGPVTVTYRIAGNLHRIIGMHRNWSIRFTRTVRRSPHDDWMSRIGRFYGGLTLLTFLCISEQYSCHRHQFLPPSTGGGVSPGTKSAVTQLIGHRMVVRQSKWCGGVCIGSVCSGGVSLIVYMYVAAQGVSS